MATIVVADDDESMQMLMCRSLATCGHQIHIASNGIDAIELVHEHIPDVLIIDANMPELSGVEALASLRAEGNEVAAVLITADARSDFESILGPQTQFLAKPFSPPRLINFVTQVINSKNGQNRA